MRLQMCVFHGSDLSEAWSAGPEGVLCGDLTSYRPPLSYRPGLSRHP